MRPSQAVDDLIFDIGMNTCEDTDFYLKKGFRVVAVEANPAMCCAAAQRYSAAIAAGRLTIINKAIAATHGTLRFYVCNSNSAWSTALPRLRAFWEARGADFTAIDVPTLSPIELVAYYGVPHYAKIDIEGSDLLSLDAFSEGAAPDYLSMEIDFGAVNEILSRLRALGYRRFAVIGQLGVVDQRAPDAAREGSYADYRFEIGSTGLFGRELPVEWQSDRAIHRRCAKIIWQYRLLGVVNRLAAITPVWANTLRRHLPLAGDWYDLHASRG